MVTVTAVYERDVQGRWLVHIAEEPRCHTWARSYAAARREIIDAVELWFGELGIESLDNLDIRDEVRIPGRPLRLGSASTSAGQRPGARCLRLNCRDGPALCPGTRPRAVTSDNG
jgi:predicted RNase H-like HicB family nuclease